MSTETILAIEPDHEAIAREIEAYKMPKVHVGQQVYWYLEGDLACDPRPGAVIQVFDRKVHIRLMSSDQWGLGQASVSHCTDPILKHHPNQKRNNGSWDFTTYDKELRDRLKRLEETMISADNLNHDGFPPEIPAAERMKAAAHNNASKQVLQAQCDSLGLKYDARWGVSRLAELLKNNEPKVQ